MRKLFDTYQKIVHTLELIQRISFKTFKKKQKSVPHLLLYIQCDNKSVRVFVPKYETHIYSSF